MGSRIPGTVRISWASFTLSFRKYHWKAYKLAQTEVGHMGQNVYLMGAALDLKICSIEMEAQNYKDLENLIGVDGNAEAVIYAQIVGV